MTDWILQKYIPRPGHEKAFEHAMRQLHGEDSWKLPPEDHHQATEVLKAASLTAFDILKAPQLKDSEIARAKFQAHIQHQRQIAQGPNCSMEFRAYWERPDAQLMALHADEHILELAECQDGLVPERYRSPIGSPMDFRGSLVEHCTLLPKPLREQASQNMTAMQMAEYAEQLTTATARLAVNQQGTDDDTAMLFAATKWLSFWARNGFGLYVFNQRRTQVEHGHAAS